MNRKPIVAGNWKMNMTTSEAVEFVASFKNLAESLSETVDIIICPPFVSLEKVSSILADSSIYSGAQNIHWEDSGAYTGEISAKMLKDIGVKYVIIGHSERRQYFGETDEVVESKVLTALKNNLMPIICIGETLEQREDGLVEKVINKQLTKAISSINIEQAKNITIAYEPIWAIGTGINANPEDANEAAGLIRKILNERFENIANSIRIQYGGSVTSDNFNEFMRQKEVDGALVGGASLKLDEFFKITKTATKY